MTRVLSIAAFILGAIIVLWMGTSFMGSNLLAFIVTGVIAVVYVIGFVELTSFQRDTQTLDNALTKTTDKVTVLNDWLALLAPSLRGSVSMRIKGEHVSLPAPMLTPYLVGLLVMLGLLGTFAGMVDTLKGAVAALEGTTELEAIRAGLAAPIKGLGTAFGTSVAGVSASAMLGFIATLSRRRRALASRLLDSKMNTTFQDFSLSYNREQTFKAMQAQAQSLPLVAEKLARVADNLTHFSNDISQQLLDNQKQFTNTVSHTYKELAQSVEHSLQKNISDSSRLLGEGIQPLIVDMVGDVNHQLNRSSEEMLNRFGDANQQWLSEQQTQDQQRLEKWHQAFENSTNNIQANLEKMSAESQSTTRTVQEDIQRLLASTEALVEQRIANEATWLSSYENRMAELNTTLTKQLTTLRDEEVQRGNNVVTQLETLQAHVTEHLQTLGVALEAPMTRLIETASETPKAAAEVISQLRAELSNTTERDNQLLVEREKIFVQLHKVSDALQQSSSQQSDNLQQLTQASAETLNNISTRFSEQMNQESTRLSGAVDNFTSSATELASLGDAFGIAVEQFSQSSNEVSQTLANVEASLQSNTERSDEQMGYYVAQAREIIDHTILSQQEVIEQLRQLGRDTQIAERG